MISTRRSNETIFTCNPISWHTADSSRKEGYKTYFGFLKPRSRFYKIIQKTDCKRSLRRDSFFCVEILSHLSYKTLSPDAFVKHMGEAWNVLPACLQVIRSSCLQQTRFFSLFLFFLFFFFLYNVRAMRLNGLGSPYGHGQNWNGEDEFEFSRRLQRGSPTFNYKMQSVRGRAGARLSRYVLNPRLEKEKKNLTAVE